MDSTIKKQTLFRLGDYWGSLRELKEYEGIEELAGGFKSYLLNNPTLNKEFETRKNEFLTLQAQEGFRKDIARFYYQLEGWRRKLDERCFVDCRAMLQYCEKMMTNKILAKDSLLAGYGKREQDENGKYYTIELFKDIDTNDLTPENISLLENFYTILNDHINKLLLMHRDFETDDIKIVVKRLLMNNKAFQEKLKLSTDSVLQYVQKYPKDTAEKHYDKIADYIHKEIFKEYPHPSINKAPHELNFDISRERYTVAASAFDGIFDHYCNIRGLSKEKDIENELGKKIPNILRKTADFYFFDKCLHPTFGIGNNCSISLFKVAFRKVVWELTCCTESKTRLRPKLQKLRTLIYTQRNAQERCVAISDIIKVCEIGGKHQIRSAQNLISELKKTEPTSPIEGYVEEFYGYPII